jgi:hypothetical protein
MILNLNKMKVRCLFDKGEALRRYEYSPIAKDIMGRFGVTGYSEYGGLTIGQEYLVMGIIIFQTYQAYLIDDNDFISACPCQLFEVMDNELSADWQFRLIEKDEDIYPFIQVIFGYSELCSDKKSYEKLIIEKDNDAKQIYFKRKIATENKKIL